MVKTTIMLEDELYRELVNESVKEYGSTRKLSMIINRKLKGLAAQTKRKRLKRLTIRLGRKITEKEIEKAIEGGFAEAIKWRV